MSMVGNKLVRVEKLYKEFPVNSGLLEQFTFEGGRMVRSTHWDRLGATYR